MYDERDLHLQQIVDEYRLQGVGKTMLIVDESKEEFTQKFFEKSADYVILDAKNLHRKKFVRKTPMPILLDECRHLLAYGMLRGKILVIRMAEISVDFYNTFCDESCPELPKANPQPPYQPWRFLPRGFILNNGENLRGDPHSLLRRDDLREVGEFILKRRAAKTKADDGEDNEEFQEQLMKSASNLGITDLSISEACDPNFRIIVTTTIKPEYLKDMLFNGRFGLPTSSPNDFILQIVS